jgi:hypothetical protein
MPSGYGVRREDLMIGYVTVGTNNNFAVFNIAPQA